MFFNNEPVIKFKCFPEYKGKIPEPYTSRHLIPDWYKKLEMYFFDDEEDENGNIRRRPTIKRCPPVLDALSVGWIIPLAADLEFTIRDNGTGVSWICGGDEGMDPEWICQNHMLGQTKGHPHHPKVPLKLINHWMVETAPGWSCIFTPPLNREEKNIELISGIVDTDKGYYETVNFPGHLLVDDGYFRMEQGYPLMQVIPFKRGFKKEAKIGILSDKELKKLDDTQQTRNKHPSLYRDQLWEKK